MQAGVLDVDTIHDKWLGAPKIVIQMVVASGT